MLFRDTISKIAPFFSEKFWIFEKIFNFWATFGFLTTFCYFCEYFWAKTFFLNENLIPEAVVALVKQ